MKDNMSVCHHTVSEDAVYKEVAIIGNGPSGMVTSFMLAGNVPYLKEVPEDLPIDDMLRARLSSVPAGQSLYEADLMALAEGLEGRSQNPIPLLMDNLLRPCADMGVQGDALIEWKYDVEKQIDHIVLGRGPPGGAWHTFPPAVRSLSPAAWLSLPPHSAPPTFSPGARLSAQHVALYCTRYVHACRLQRYFRTGVTVTGVTLAQRSHHTKCQCAGCPLKARWIVTGYDNATGCMFRYHVRRVVLASGATERPNTLSPHVATHCAHSLPEVTRGERALRKSGSPYPVLVVGSGLSAADAVASCREAGLQVAHVYRKPAASIAGLTHSLYPDYTEIYRMMCDGPNVKHENYIPYPHNVILDVSPTSDTIAIPYKHRDDPELYKTIRPKRVKLLNLVTNEITEITVTLICVLIGSKPDLFFLPNFSLKSIDVAQSVCQKCIENKKLADSQCFFKNHWHYIKSMLGQSIQICKSKLNTEINGNDTKCIVEECNKKNVVSKIENGVAKSEIQSCKCQVIPYGERCGCLEENPFSNGLGFGIDPTKAVDGKSNPIAIDKSTHEVLHAPRGMYALGPLTADNFIRFIPGGALALVAHSQR